MEQGIIIISIRNKVEVIGWILRMMQLIKSLFKVKSMEITKYHINIDGFIQVYDNFY